MKIPDYKRLMRSKSKYKNKRFENRYGKWDSEKEYKHFLLLMDRMKKGEIRNLRRQVRIEIQPGFVDHKGKKIAAITYRADFTYDDLIDGKHHVVDVKGYRTDVYKLKKKLLLYKGIEIEEI